MKSYLEQIRLKICTACGCIWKTGCGDGNTSIQCKDMSKCRKRHQFLSETHHVAFRNKNQNTNYFNIKAVFRLTYARRHKHYGRACVRARVSACMRTCVYVRVHSTLQKFKSVH